MKIGVVGLRYVGLSNDLVLSRNDEMAAVDSSSEPVGTLNAHKLQIIGLELKAFLGSWLPTADDRNSRRESSILHPRVG